MNSQTSRSEASGRCAGDLAHDISNLLLVVTWSSRQLLEQLPEDDGRRQLVDAIYNASSQAADLSRQVQELTNGRAISSADTSDELAVLNPGTGDETILLVEDDPQILELLKRRLERAGYRVLAASLGSAAIAMAMDHAEAIHLLVTDLQMPDLSGREVATLLREQFPDLPALFLSGQVFEASPGDSPQQSISYLQKPFKSRDLLAKVREMIDSSAHRPNK